MNTIETRLILDAGAKSIHNTSPDALVRRTTLAHLLMTARVVKSIDAGVLAFKIWATPGAQVHTAKVICDLANEKVLS